MIQNIIKKIKTEYKETLKEKFFFSLIYILSFVLVITSVVFQNDSHESVSEPDVNPSSYQYVKVNNRTKLYIIFIDSLSDRLVGNGKMPFLDSLLKKGVSGKQKICADGLTLPCIEAAFTGKDSSSAFSFLKDFIITEGMLKQKTIFDILKTRGYRIGAVGDYTWKRFKLAFLTDIIYNIEHTQSDTTILKDSLSLKTTRDHNLDIMITSLGEIDYAAHTFMPGSKKYYQIVNETDNRIKTLFNKLPSDWNLFIFGDHGHNEKGRHSGGLDIPSAYVYYGPAFKKGINREINIKDNYFILSRLFDIQLNNVPNKLKTDEFFEPDWIKSHNLISATQNSLSRNTTHRQYNNTSYQKNYEFIFLIFFMFIGGIVFSSIFKRLPLKISFSIGASIILLQWMEGLSYVWLRSKIYMKPWWYDYIFIIIEFVICYIVIKSIKKSSVFDRLVLSILCFVLFNTFFLLPTVYNFGSERYIIHGIVFSLLAFSYYFYTQYKKNDKKININILLLLIISFILGILNIDMSVSNFQFKYLYWSHTLFELVNPLIPYLFFTGLLFILLFYRKWIQTITAFIIFHLISIFSQFFPPWVYIIPFIITIILFLPSYIKPNIINKIGTEWNMFFILIVIHYFFNFSMQQTSEIAVLIILCITISKIIVEILKDRQSNERTELLYLVSTLIVLLSLFSYWIIGIRTSSLNFQPVLQWFPQNKLLGLWYIIFIIMIYFYALPILSFFAIIKKFIPDSILFFKKQLFFISIGKIICLGIFLRSMLIKKPPQLVLTDSMEELVFWSVIALIGWAVYFFGGKFNEKIN